MFPHLRHYFAETAIPQTCPRFPCLGFLRKNVSFEQIWVFEQVCVLSFSTLPPSKDIYDKKAIAVAAMVVHRVFDESDCSYTTHTYSYIRLVQSFSYFFHQDTHAPHSTSFIPKVEARVSRGITRYQKNKNNRTIPTQENDISKKSKAQLCCTNTNRF